MSILFEEKLQNESLLAVARKMLTAARTAPKGKGVDNMVLAIVENYEIQKIATKMKEMVERDQAPKFFLRDANNIMDSKVLVLLGTKISPLGVTFCGQCGFSDCNEKIKYPDHPCAFNTGDLGIAIGSAVSVAMDERVDNRIMYSVGKAVKELNLLGDEVRIIYGIPLSSTGKNLFFDRKQIE